ncbi:MAG: FtsB family cell division protein [Christensenellales bacterium]
MAKSGEGREKADLKLVPQNRTSGNSARRRRYRRLAFFLACMFVIIIGAVSILSQYGSISKQRAEMEALKSDIEEAQAVNDEMLRVLNYMKTDDYVRSFAREQLGLMLPGEIRFIEDDSK